MTYPRPSPYEMEDCSVVVAEDNIILCEECFCFIRDTSLFMIIFLIFNAEIFCKIQYTVKSLFFEPPREAKLKEFHQSREGGTLDIFG